MSLQECLETRKDCSGASRILPKKIILKDLVYLLNHMILLKVNNKNLVVGISRIRI
ncbi:MAG: hypothetical protein ACFFB0_17125 [Promethearchaeota archaeon]